MKRIEFNQDDKERGFRSERRGERRVVKFVAVVTCVDESESLRHLTLAFLPSFLPASMSVKGTTHRSKRTVKDNHFDAHWGDFSIFLMDGTTAKNKYFPTRQILSLFTVQKE